MKKQMYLKEFKRTRIRRICYNVDVSLLSISFQLFRSVPTSNVYFVSGVPFCVDIKCLSVSVVPSCVDIKCLFPFR